MGEPGSDATRSVRCTRQRRDESLNLDRQNMCGGTEGGARGSALGSSRTGFSVREEWESRQRATPHWPKTTGHQSDTDLRHPTRRVRQRSGAARCGGLRAEIRKRRPRQRRLEGRETSRRRFPRIRPGAAVNAHKRQSDGRHRRESICRSAPISLAPRATHKPALRWVQSRSTVVSDMVRDWRCTKGCARRPFESAARNRVMVIRSGKS